MKHPITHPLPLSRGLIGRVAISCTHPESGLEGSWLFSGDTWREPGSAVTPLFADLCELFTWMRATGWQQVGVGLDSAYTYSTPVAPANLAVFDR